MTKKIKWKKAPKIPSRVVFLGMAEQLDIIEEKNKKITRPRGPRHEQTHGLFCDSTGKMLVIASIENIEKISSKKAREIFTASIVKLWTTWTDGKPRECAFTIHVDADEKTKLTKIGEAKEIKYFSDKWTKRGVHYVHTFENRCPVYVSDTRRGLGSSVVLVVCPRGPMLNETGIIG